jgi:hypothetical protein
VWRKHEERGPSVHKYYGCGSPRLADVDGHGAEPARAYDQLGTQQNSGVTTGLYGVSAVSPTTAWISGHYGFAARTADGGGTWTPENPVTITSFYTALFPGAGNGWVAGETSATAGAAQGRTYRRSDGATQEQTATGYTFDAATHTDEERHQTGG